MRKVIKKATTQKAFELGVNSRLEAEYIEKGFIKVKGNDYEIITKETKQGEKGEKAVRGDFVKIDVKGNIYPNKREFFLKNHQLISEEQNLYEQVSKPVFAWFEGDEKTAEIEFLIKHKGLKLHYDNPENFYEAEIWGTVCTAPQDAILIIHRVDRDDYNNILDVGFQFVDYKIYEETYESIE